MKAIITRALSDGTYQCVGTDNRTILSCKRESRLWKFAQRYSRGYPFRLEIWDNENEFYATGPNRVEYGEGRLTITVS